MQKAERYQLDKSQICRSAEQKMGFVLCSYFALSDGKVKLRFFLITMQAISAWVSVSPLKCLVVLEEMEGVEGLLLSASPARLAAMQ